MPGPDVESASVRAGKWMYLFFNRNNSRTIEFWKVDDEERKPKSFTIKVAGNKDVGAIGESIAVVYLPKLDEIHAYFAAEKDVRGKTKVVIKELALRSASKDADPADWSEDDQHLNSKNEPIDPMSILSAVIDDRDYPRLFYQKVDDLEQVSYAAYDDIRNKQGGSTGQKDWTTTTFTGVGV